MSRLHGVVCYWEFVPSATEFREDCRWRLAESFGVDADGYSLTRPSTGGGGRYEWGKWLNTPIYRYKGQWLTAGELKAAGETETESFPEDKREIMGRAVTIWTMGGVELLGLHPPEWTSWLAVGFYDEIRRLPNWSSLLESGYDLRLGTAREAEKYLEFKNKKDA